jgi:hypothetical protein
VSCSVVLIAVLCGIFVPSPPLSVESCLHCVLTSFTTLRGHGASLTIDVKEVRIGLVVSFDPRMKARLLLKALLWRSCWESCGCA